jgi:hypothetical protein
MGFFRKRNTTLSTIQHEEYRKICEEFGDISEENISVLIRHRLGMYVVFLDSDGDLDWETTNKYDTAHEKTMGERDKLLAEIEWLQHQPCVQLISKNRRKCFISLLAECWCFALDGYFGISNNHLKRAEQYLNDRKIETSRKWQLISCFAIVSVLILTVTAINNIFYISNTFADCSEYLLFGALGTVLSLIINGNIRTYNCESGKLLNILEVLSRLIASLLSCVVIILLFDLNIIFTTLKDYNSNETLRLLCVLAGFSERLIPSILQKMENDTIKESKK